MSYDAFASTFSASRKNLRWGEIEYFVEYMRNRSWDKKISLLDVGCGNGRLLETLESSFSPLSSKGEAPRRQYSCGRSGVRTYDYLGVDASEGMITEARKLHPDEAFRVLDMNHLETLPDNARYDYILLIASFHHLETTLERNQVLASLRKLLAPNGCIMMTNWNLLGEELFPKYESAHRGGGDFGIKIGAYERYYHGFELHELENLFTQNGFVIVENRVFDGGKNIISILKMI